MHNLQKNLACAAAVFGLVFLSGCATIVGDNTQIIPIKSTPAGAQVSIYDEAGRDVFQGVTPTKVDLGKSTGKYWGGKRYHVSISKDGHYGRAMTITAHANGWYLAGNLVFGGAIGWFLIDPWNGKMYSLSPDGIDASLPAIVGVGHPVPVQPKDPARAPVRANPPPMSLGAPVALTPAAPVPAAPTPAAPTPTAPAPAALTPEAPVPAAPAPAAPAPAPAPPPPPPPPSAQ